MRRRPLWVVALLLAALVPLSLAVGAAGLTTDPVVLLGIRLPRILAAVLGGAAMATAGALLQSALRNPLAEPGIVGLAPAAALAAAIGASITTAVPVPHLAAVVGVALAIVILRAAAGLDAAPLRYLAIGIGLNAACLAALGIVATLGGRRDLLFWSLGSTSAATTAAVVVMAIALVAGLLVTARIADDVDILSLGRAGAIGLGVDARRTTVAAIVAAGLLIAVTVATVGMIALLGLAVPHYARTLMGSAMRRLAPLSALLGATVLLIADTIARTIVAPVELPLGAVVAIASIPAFIAAARQVSA